MPAESDDADDDDDDCSADAGRKARNPAMRSARAPNSAVIFENASVGAMLAALRGN